MEAVVMGETPAHIPLTGDGAGEIRPDLRIIADMVAPGSRVLDIGCERGELLAYLVRHKNVDGRGIELSMEGVSAGVSNGLSIIQGDADTDLEFYPDDSFHYAILSRTLQAVRDPLGVLRHLVRIGDRAIVSFPNFGYWRVRLKLLTTGRMPVTEMLSEPWYATPNIHLCTIADFVALCRKLDIGIERSIVLRRGGRDMRSGEGGRGNLFGEQAVFLLRRGA